MSIFQAVIDRQHVLPMDYTFIKLFVLPGESCQLAARIQVCTSQLITPEGTPIAIKGLYIIAAIKLYHRQQRLPLCLFIFVALRLLRSGLLVLKCSHIIVNVVPKVRSKIKRIAAPLGYNARDL